MLWSKTDLLAGVHLRCEILGVAQVRRFMDIDHYSCVHAP